MAADSSHVALQQGIEASVAVQEEDVTLCEAVQRGLASPAYNGGRYAEATEAARVLDDSLWFPMVPAFFRDPLS